MWLLWCCCIRVGRSRLLSLYANIRQSCEHSYLCFLPRELFEKVVDMLVLSDIYVNLFTRGSAVALCLSCVLAGGKLAG